MIAVPNNSSENNVENDIGESQILSFNDIKLAAQRIEGAVIHTPLCEAKISRYMDYTVYFKCENLQPTGSCMERAVRNVFASDLDNLRVKGVIVPSNGDTGVAAAYHGSYQLKIPVTAVLPERAPSSYAQTCAEYGADVVLCGDNVDNAISYAKKQHKETGQYYLSTNNLQMLAGLGTVGVEIITQLPELDAIIVPVGDGSLLAAIMVVCKKMKCSCLVYGAECSKVPNMTKCLHHGKPTPVKIVPNLAEGLNASITNMNAFVNIKGRLDRMLMVDELWIARAMINMLERERLVADGAGVCGLAALMQGLVPELKGKSVVCIISSGNVDCSRLTRVIHRGLAACSRLVRCAIPIPDKKDGFAKLANVISEEKCTLKSLVTEQMWVHSDVSTTWTNLVVETTNEEDALKLKEKICHLYPGAKFALAEHGDKADSKSL